MPEGTRKSAPALQGKPLLKSWLFAQFLHMLNVVVFLRGIYDFACVAILAEGGLDVTCIDVGGKWVECIRKGEFPDFLPCLRETIVRNQREGSLRFAENLDCVDRDLVLCVQRGKLNPTAEERKAVENVYKECIFKKKNVRKS